MDELEPLKEALEDASSVNHVESDKNSTSRDEETPRTAREVGWSEPVPYNYEDYGNKEARDWAGVAARYEWKDEYGDVGPPNKELEDQLFHHEYIPRVGQKFEELNAPQVTCESVEKVAPIANVKFKCHSQWSIHSNHQQWEDAGLHPVILENIKLCLYTKPTAVQCYAVPAILQGKDLIAVAQTGSGKTASFFIPILSKLMGKAKKWAAARPNVTEGFDPKNDGVRAEPLVLVVCPTRELATQIFDEARRLCYRSMLRPCVVYGGAPTRMQRDELRKGCDILIGTPGRILDFMGQPHVLTLSRVKFTVIDEADELLHADWEEDFRKLMSGGDMNEDEDHRYMMFSATFDKQCRKLARKYLALDHVRVRIGRAGSSHHNVHQEIIYVEERKKKQALCDLLKSMHPVRTLIFVNNKQEVDFVDDLLYHEGFPSTSIHGDRTQREREDAIRSFRKAQSPIMIATGISARGLDIVNVLHVINYDLPRMMHGGINEYIHRIGRTARIGNEGIATSFYNNEKDEDLAPDLVKVLLECGEEVPDFLDHFRPPGDIVTFEDDVTDDEQEGAGASDEAATATATEDQAVEVSQEEGSDAGGW